MESRGAVTGGSTISDYMAFFASQGYDGTLVVRPGGHVECLSCGTVQDADGIQVDRVRRTEGASDPSDMCAVFAITCPECHTRGTLTACVGPAAASREEAEVLRMLDHTMRHSRAGEPEQGDASLVRDTGWLSGPKLG